MIRKIFLTMALLLSLSFGAAAQTTNTKSGRERMIEFANKYEDSKEITSMICTKGRGLDMFKLLMRGEYGKEFFKGVDIIIFVEYGDASAEQAKTLTKEMEALCQDFDEIDIPESEGTKDKKIRTFLKFNSDNNITDMVVILEDSEDKGMTYFGGVIKLEDFKTE